MSQAAEAIVPPLNLQGKDLFNPFPLNSDQDIISSYKINSTNQVDELQEEKNTKWGITCIS